MISEVLDIDAENHFNDVLLTKPIYKDFTKHLGTITIKKVMFGNRPIIVKTLLTSMSCQLLTRSSHKQKLSVM